MTNTKQLLQPKDIDIIDSPNFDLSDDQVSKITENQIKKTGIEILGDALGFGSAVKLFSINSEVQKEVRQKRIEKVINACFTLTKNNQETLDRLIKLLQSPTGNILYNKFLGITDDIDPEKDEYIIYFSKILKTIIESDFDRLFEKHNYALSIINSLSIQSTVILVDHRKWKVFSLHELRGKFSFEDGTLTTSRWRPLFVDQYLSEKVITGSTFEEVKARVVNALSELERHELVVPKIVNNTGTMSMSSVKEANMHAQLQLTNIGAEISSYFLD